MGEFSHTNDNGDRVNWQGYDQNGTFRGNYQSNSAGGSQDSGGGGSAGAGAGGGGLVLLGIIIYLLYQAWKKWLIFYGNNHVSLKIYLGIIAVCVITCLIFKFAARKPGLKIFLAIIVSLGLIITVYSFGMKRGDGNFNNFKMEQITNIFPFKKNKEHVAIATTVVTEQIQTVSVKPNTQTNPKPPVAQTQTVLEQIAVVQEILEPPVEQTQEESAQTSFEQIELTEEGGE